MALPVIKAIQTKVFQDNLETQFSLLVRPQYVSLLEKLDIAGEKIALPEKNWQYFFRCLKWRGQFDAQIMFTNSERGDVEAWLMGTPERYGIARPKKPRRLLTHRYTLSENFDEDALHQTFLWRDFTAQFDLHEGDELDLTPFTNPIKAKRGHVGLICGSANTPEKRWSSENWQRLITALLEKNVEQIVLLGTKDDIDVCANIAKAVNDSCVQNLAGKTNLAELVDVMRKQSLIIGNDTGGLHLANALGISVVGLYGLTNPIRSRPIHDAPLTTIQSPKGYGEGKMADITVEAVLAAVS